MPVPARQSSSYFRSDALSLVCARLDGPDRRIQQCPGDYGSDSGIAPRAVRSSFGDVMVAVSPDGSLLGHWMRDGFGWHGHGWFGYRATDRYTGCAVIQSGYGRLGNFELIASSAGRLTHYWLNNDSSGHSWAEAQSFGSAPAGTGYQGVGLIQSDWGTLEVVAVKNGAIEFFQQDGPGGAWRGPTVFRPSVPVTGRLGFVQGPWGSKGNYEVVVAVDDAAGGLLHLWRDNDPHPGESRPGVERGWQESVRFGQGRRYADVGILPEFVNSPRIGVTNHQLALLAYGDGPQVDYFSRSDGAPHPWQWQGPYQPEQYQMHRPPAPPPPPRVPPMEYLTFVAEIASDVAVRDVWVDYTPAGGSLARAVLAPAGAYWQQQVRPASRGNWSYRFGLRTTAGQVYVSELAGFDWERGNPAVSAHFLQQPSGSGTFVWTVDPARYD